MLLLLLNSKDLISCDCIMHPVEKYIDTSEYIATARVVRFIEHEGTDSVGYKALLVVTKVFKGQIKIENRLAFDSDSSDCAFKFVVNKEYLLFFCKRSNKFYVYHCSYSDEVNNSMEYILKIKKYISKTSSVKRRRLHLKL